MWYVYILECQDGRLYTGITKDLERRVKQHKSGNGGRFTRSFGFKKLLYSEKKRSRPAALKRESEIKRWPKEKKQKLFI